MSSHPDGEEILPEGSVDPWYCESNGWPLSSIDSRKENNSLGSTATMPLRILKVSMWSSSCIEVKRVKVDIVTLRCPWDGRCAQCTHEINETLGLSPETIWRVVHLMFPVEMLCDGITNDRSKTSQVIEVRRMWPYLVGVQLEKWSYHTPVPVVRDLTRWKRERGGGGEVATCWEFSWAGISNSLEQNSSGPGNLVRSRLERLLNTQVEVIIIVSIEQCGIKVGRWRRDARCRLQRGSHEGGISQTMKHLFWVCLSHVRFFCNCWAPQHNF